MPSSGYTAITFVADQLLTSTIMNQMAANDAAFNNGNGFNDGAIIARHMAALSVNPPALVDMDWFKSLFPGNYTSGVGDWKLIAGSVSGNPFYDKLEDGLASVINDYVDFKTVLQAGTYKLVYSGDKDVNRAIITFYVDGVSVGTYDGYATPRVNTTLTTISSSIVIPTSKLVTIRIKVTSKNASSSGYVTAMQRIDLGRLS